MKRLVQILVLLMITSSCSLNDLVNEETNAKNNLKFGSDFSLLKKMEDFGGVYKINGIEKEGMQIFKENGFTWARLRLFHDPELKGPVCNDLDYTLEMAHKAKLYGYKILLDFHYSDEWADPGHQTLPKAWQNLRFDILTDSVYLYTKNVINILTKQGSAPDMVQIGNEINNGMLWPSGYLWEEGGNPKWDNLVGLLKAGIDGVKAADNSGKIKIMIHGATGGNTTASERFYSNIIERGVDFDVIGLSYYPWWHGDLQKLENTIFSLSSKFNHEISIVETAYYSNGWYPESSDWVFIEKPYPPNEQGQYEFMRNLAKTMLNHSSVTTIFYSDPDELDIPESKVPYRGRSLFDNHGNAFKGIAAWKNIN